MRLLQDKSQILNPGRRERRRKKIQLTEQILDTILILQDEVEVAPDTVPREYKNNNKGNTGDGKMKNKKRK